MKNFLDLLKVYFVAGVKVLGVLLLEVLIVDAVVGCFVLGNLIVTTTSTGKLVMLVVILAAACLLGLLIYVVLSKKSTQPSYYRLALLREIALMFFALLVLSFVVGLLLCYTQFIMFNGVRVLFSSLGFFGVMFCVLAVSLLFSTGATTYYIHMINKKK